MREKEEKTVGGGCRTWQMSEHVVRKLEIFGREMAHLETSNTCALQCRPHVSVSCKNKGAVQIPVPFLEVNWSLSTSILQTILGKSTDTQSDTTLHPLKIKELGWKPTVSTPTLPTHSYRPSCERFHLPSDDKLSQDPDLCNYSPHTQL